MSQSEWRAARALRQSTGSTSPNSTTSPRRAAATHSSPCHMRRTSRCGCIDCAATGASSHSRAHNCRGHHHLLWRADRLLVAEWNEETQSHAVAEFEVSGARIERRRQLIAADERIRVFRWCAVDDGVAIADATRRTCCCIARACNGERLGSSCTRQPQVTRRGLRKRTPPPL